MRLIYLVLLTFICSTSFSYEEKLYAFLKNKSQSNFIKLEESFEKIESRDEKARLAFILFNSDFETKVNEKSYYSFYALRFYKGKDSELLSSAFLRVISVFYYQGNIDEAKVYLNQLRKKKELNKKSKDLISYYDGLILLSEKKYSKGIKELSKLYLSTDDSAYKDVIPQELARASLLDSKNLKYIPSAFLKNQIYLEGLSKFIKTIDADKVQKILVNNVQHSHFASFSNSILKSTSAFEEPCSILAWLNKYKRVKRKANYSSYSHLVNACYINNKENKKLVSFLDTIKLKKTDRILRAIAKNNYHSCKDLLLTLKESEEIAQTQVVVVLSNINKHCKEDFLKKESSLLIKTINNNIDYISNEMNYSNLENILSFHDIRSSLIITSTNQKIIDFIWNTYTNNPKGLETALKSNKIITSQETTENIIRMLLNWKDQTKASELLNHPSLKDKKEIYTSLLNGTPLTANTETICKNNSSLEKEALLRGLISKRNSKEISTNFSCFEELIEQDQYYKETLISLWKEAPESISSNKGFSEVLNFIKTELSTKNPARWKKSYSKYFNRKQNNDFLQYRYLKLHSKRISRGKDITSKIKSIKKMSYWFNNLSIDRVKPTASILLNKSIDKTIRFIKKGIKDKNQQGSLIEALQNWRPVNE